MPFPRIDDEDTPQSVVMPPSPYPTPNLNAASATAEEGPLNHGMSAALPMKSATPAPVVQKPKLTPPPALPGMPPDVMPDDLDQYLGKTKEETTKFGPEQQVELENSLVNQRNGFGYQLADAGKGFADALMQGVAGAGNPGWQKQFEDQNMMQGQEQMGVLQKAHEGQLQDTQAGMNLDKMDPNSTLSKSAQKNYEPLFKKLGYQAGAINGMSAANIDNALQLMTAYGGKEIEAKIKEYELAIERTRLEGVLSHQSSEEQLARDKNQQEALGDLSKMPWYSRIMHPGISDALEESAGMKQPEESTVTIQDSTGGTHSIYAKNLESARKRDPGLKVME